MLRWLSAVTIFEVRLMGVALCEVGFWKALKWLVWQSNWRPVRVCARGRFRDISIRFCDGLFIRLVHSVTGVTSTMTYEQSGRHLRECRSFMQKRIGRHLLPTFGQRCGHFCDLVALQRWTSAFVHELICNIADIILWKIHFSRLPWSKFHVVNRAL